MAEKGISPISTPQKGNKSHFNWTYPLFDQLRPVRAWATVVLTVSAGIALGFGVSLAVAREDTEVLESPLVLAVARQLREGPWGLYGPFVAGNHLVLIHAPLYYHTSALLAWVLYRLGIDAVDAALAAGRAISLLGLLITLTAAYRLCRLDGATRRAGWWTVLLIAASHIVGVLPFTVRPDMLGVAFQSVGVVLVLATLRSDAPKGWMLPAGYCAFALALCVKQHFVIGPLVSTGLALAAWRRGRLPLKLIERGVLTGLGVTLALYGFEELATGGRMSQSIFQAAAAASRVHAGGWSRAYLLMFSITGRSSGLAMLMIAAGVAGLRDRSGWAWKALAIAGTGLICLFVARSLLDLSHRPEASWEPPLAFVTIVSTMVLALPACVVLGRPVWARHWLDRGMFMYLAGELVLLVALGWSSTGSWANYGIQATVFASVLAARALDRVCTGPLSARAAAPIVAALLVVLIGVCARSWTTAERNRMERRAIAEIFDHFARPSSEYFFVGRPGTNRINGRLDLVYDDWLYPVFESIHLAEPRSAWLRRTLVAGSVRFIVNTTDEPEIDGIAEPVPKLGYIRTVRHGPFFVWERITGVVPKSGVIPRPAAL
jgi:hypothetical protein